MSDTPGPPCDHFDEEAVRIIREAFERMVSASWAVSKPHRESIATRLITAARDGVTSVDDLIERAAAIPIAPPGDSETGA